MVWAEHGSPVLAWMPPLPFEPLAPGPTAHLSGSLRTFTVHPGALSRPLSLIDRKEGGLPYSEEVVGGEEEAPVWPPMGRGFVGIGLICGDSSSMQPLATARHACVWGWSLGEKGDPTFGKFSGIAVVFILGVEVRPDT
ncbi:hypothetical protein H8959_011181 [Pygathrix nigripes]